jgi:hypothetical protein
MQFFNWDEENVMNETNLPQLARIWRKSTMFCESSERILMHKVEGTVVKGQEHLAEACRLV